MTIVRVYSSGWLGVLLDELEFTSESDALHYASEKQDEGFKVRVL